MRRLTISTSLAAIALVALTACGSDSGDDKDDDVFSGDDVAAKAEEALSGEVDNLAEGGFDCPDVDREEGATATCTRSSEAEGYYLTIDGEVEITEVDGDDFALHVQMEDQPKTFGTTGESIEQDISTQAESRFGEAPSSIECPDLPGEDGATVTCEMTVNDEDKQIEVTATEVDLAAFTMSWTFAEVTS